MKYWKRNPNIVKTKNDLKTKENSNNTNINFSSDILEIKLMLNEINKRNQIKEKMQNEMGFTIPNYIIDEIAEPKTNISYSNLFYLINMAIINNRISSYNARKLKIYVSNGIK